MIHGIYAADYDLLSARSSVFGPLWHLERQHGGVIKGLLKRNQSAPDHVAEELARQLKSSLPAEITSASVWGLKGGLETLTKTMTRWLMSQPNIQLRTDQMVTEVKRETDNTYRVSVFSFSALVYSHIFDVVWIRFLHLRDSLQRTSSSQPCHLACFMTAWCQTFEHRCFI